MENDILKDRKNALFFAYSILTDKWIKRLFCRHEWQVCRKVNLHGFSCISGEQLYKRCTKCGKVKKHIFVVYEWMGYK